MSQEEIGLAAGTDQARISRIESGESPRVVLFQPLARALGWSGVELMQRLEEREAALAQAEDAEAQQADGRRREGASADAPVGSALDRRPGGAPLSPRG